ncbi:MAG: SAM-dependent methyltransferase [Anaerolineales bacterium]
MKKNQSSITAQGIAAIRALEATKLPQQRICNDPLARRMVAPVIFIFTKLFAGYGEWRAPGTIEYILARTRYFDDYLQSCLESGIDQLVILGAGLDTRAYRFMELENRVKVFEVDHPVTQKEKCKKLQKIFGDLPRHVSYVPIDFNVENLEKLFQYGYQKNQKTLFIWEGVTYYLTKDAVNHTLQFVAQTAGSGSTIIFDYVYTSALHAAHKRGEIVRMQRYGRFTGEMMIFGIEEGKVAEFLSQRGFSQIVNVTSEDLRKLYFRGANQNKPIAPIYAIVHATVS